MRYREIITEKRRKRPYVGADLPEGSIVSEEFIEALRAWGKNTVEDKDGKMQWLMQFENVAKNFRQPVDWLYRGHCLYHKEILQTLRQEGELSLDLGRLSSWTHSFDTANYFAEAGSPGILIEKQGLTPFFDFTLLGQYLESIGYEVDETDHELFDPIREQEVIVLHNGPMIISQDDIGQVYD